ncbi:MAG: YHS domain-containing protein [Chromatiaceae bacterium]|jgi:YHS domain-containing protein
MQVQCPVCHMPVEPNQLILVYHRMHFAFCSEQCRERFQAAPHLYVGVPGQKAPKQEGQEVLKRRCLRLDVAPTAEQGRLITEALGAMMGVRRIAVEGKAVDITYDLLETTEEQIERTLLETGASLGSGWTERLRRALVHYAEDCEASNMEVTGRPPHHHG